MIKSKIAASILSFLVINQEASSVENFQTATQKNSKLGYNFENYISPVIYLVKGHQPHIAYKNGKVTTGGYDEYPAYLTEFRSIPLDLPEIENDLSIESFSNENSSFCKNLQLTIHEQQILLPKIFPALKTSTSCHFNILSSDYNSNIGVVKEITLIFNYTVQGWRSSLGDGTEAQRTANLINDNDLNSTSLNLNSNEQRFNNINKVVEDISPITTLPNLQKLYICSHRIEIIPDAIKNLTNLTELHLSNNQIRVIPKTVKYLTKLQKLFLDDNKIKELPIELGNLIELKWLNLSANKIKTISKHLESLVNLTELNLRHNKLNRIPDFIGNLTYLTNLNLSENKIISVPSFIGNLINLKVLDLDDNSIRYAHENINTLTQLETLNFPHESCRSCVNLNIQNN